MTLIILFGSPEFIIPATIIGYITTSVLLLHNVNKVFKDLNISFKIFYSLFVLFLIIFPAFVYILVSNPHLRHGAGSNGSGSTPVEIAYGEEAEAEAEAEEPDATPTPRRLLLVLCYTIFIFVPMIGMNIHLLVNKINKGIEGEIKKKSWYESKRLGELQDLRLFAALNLVCTIIIYLAMVFVIYSIS